jgi:hypothetical protein
MLIKTPTPVRIAASFGTFEVDSDGVDTTGGDYLGIGTLSDMPALNSLINGQASRADFSLAAYGSQGDTLATAIEADSDDLRGAPVHVGFITQDSDYQTVGDAFWLWAGKGDKTSVTKQATAGGILKTIALSVGTIFARRKQGRPSYYTDSEQRTRSATDGFCKNVKGYSQETTKPWPG